MLLGEMAWLPAMVCRNYDHAQATEGVTMKRRKGIGSQLRPIGRAARWVGLGLLVISACRSPRSEEVVAISSGLTYTVGPQGQYAELSDLPQLSPGDLVQVAWRATPYGSVVFRGQGTTSQPITVQGI